MPDITILIRSMGLNVWLISLAVTLFHPTAVSGAPEDWTIEPSLLENIRWRSIGPCNMGGRMTDIEGVPGDPNVLYLGYASSGLWKTTNGGITATPLFDDQPVHAIGDLALAPSNPEVIYVGTGEDNPRNTASFGNGVYKSMDGGRTWKHVGLEDTRHIPRVLVHPEHPDIVYVAALGHEFGMNEERGIFMTTDGGETWDKVLYIDEETGASDVEMDPSNPNILYAGMWTFMRKPWSMRSGSENGGLFKSVDGGRTWAKLKDGLPTLIGKIGVKVARSNPRVVYALLESKGNTLFRSEDRGETWKRVYTEWDILGRGFYSTELRVDPENENLVYTLDGGVHVSTDGGKTFGTIVTNTHGDNRTMYIDPLDPDFLLVGNDGGFGLSRDKGENFEYVRSWPLGQIYQLTADNEVPFYTIYAGFQDNGSWGGPARSRHRYGISNAEWFRIGPGDGSHIVIHPDKPYWLLEDSQGGNIHRFDTRTGQAQRISPYPGNIVTGAPAADHDFRFDWGAPIVLSPHEPRSVYFGGNVLFKSTDFGTTWEQISPDLTTDDAEKQQNSGGPITYDNTTAEFHCVILDIAESPVQKDLIWVGTDDTQIQITRDGGTSWENLTGNVSGLPSEAIVSHIEASITDPAVAYMTADRHQLDDFRPYVFKTTDFGKTWRNITGNLPPNAYVHVLREDRRNPRLLYVGTEIGIFASTTGGQQWFPLRMNLPRAVAVHDILVHPEENDLIIGTHGRSIWILDDVGFLQQTSPEVLESEVHLFKLRKAWRFTPWNAEGSADRGGDQEFWGENPEYGALIDYYLKDAPDEETPVQIQVLDPRGSVIREIEAAKHPGFNRVVWDLRYEGPRQLKLDIGRPSWDQSRPAGPRVVPAEYSVRLTVGDKTLTETVQVARDPGLEVSEADLKAELEAALKTRDLISSLNAAINALDSLEQQTENIQQNIKLAIQEIPEEVDEPLGELLEEIDEQRKTMVKRERPSYGTATKLLGKLRGWLEALDSADAAPTRYQLEYLDKLSAEHRAAIQATNRIIQERVPQVNGVLERHHLPTLVVKEVSP